MNKFTDIKPTSKLTSLTNQEAIVDLITDEGIYISYRWASLKQYHRLYFTKNQVENMFESKKRLLVDWRMKITIAELRKYCGSMSFIEWIDKIIPLEEVISNNIVWHIIYDVNSNSCRKFFGISEDKKTIILSPSWTSIKEAEVTKIKVNYNYDDIKNFISSTPKNTISLDEIARKMWLKNSSFFLITDLSNG